MSTERYPEQERLAYNLGFRDGNRGWDIQWNVGIYAQRYRDAYLAGHAEGAALKAKRDLGT